MTISAMKLTVCGEEIGCLYTDRACSNYFFLIIFWIRS